MFRADLFAISQVWTLESSLFTVAARSDSNALICSSFKKSNLGNRDKQSCKTNVLTGNRQVKVYVLFHQSCKTSNIIIETMYLECWRRDDIWLSALQHYPIIFLRCENNAYFKLLGLGQWSLFSHASRSQDLVRPYHVSRGFGFRVSLDGLSERGTTLRKMSKFSKI